MKRTTRLLGAALTSLFLAGLAGAQTFLVQPVSDLPVFAAPVLVRAAAAPTLSLTAPLSLPSPLLPSLSAPKPAAVPVVRALAAPVLAEAALSQGTKVQKTLADPAAAPSSTLASFYDGGALSVSLSGPVDASAPAGRSETEGLQGKALFDALHQISGRGHRVNGYDEARHYMYKTADHVTVNGATGLIDAYSGAFVPGTSDNGGDYAERGDQNGDGYVDSKGMNAEHVWPQSFFDKKLPMKSDLHHLMATFMKPNEMRGHLPFGEVRGAVEYHNKGGAKMGQGVFEPPDATKGRVARALLYFYVRYYDRNITNGGFGDNFWNDKLEMILRWNRTYPPDENEKRRNGLVEKFQGNRNPFIDDPGLADRIGADALRRNGRWGMGYGYKPHRPR